MKPELHFASVDVSTMGIMLAVGAIASLLLLIRQARVMRLPDRLPLRVFIIVLVASLVGSKAFYMVSTALLTVNGGSPHAGISLHGSASMGAIIAASLSLLWYARWEGMSGWTLLDCAAPPWAILTALGRVGCLAAGCCFGTPTSSVFGVVFDPSTPAGHVFPATPLIPTQAIQAAGALIPAVISLTLLRKHAGTGAVFAFVLFYFGLERAVIDFLRYQGRPGGPADVARLLGIPLSQLLGTGLALVGAVAFARLLFRRGRDATGGKTKQGK